MIRRRTTLHILTSVRTESDLRPETRAALAALRAARPLVQERRGANEVTEKALNDIVTRTDVLVQDVLQQVLREHHPDMMWRCTTSGAVRSHGMRWSSCSVPDCWHSLPRR